jgi:hypothetical protein
VAGIAVICSATPSQDIDAVRSANKEDPHRKIHEGGPAVRRVTA